MGLIDGCTAVSPACDHCWLRAMNRRFKRPVPPAPMMNMTKVQPLLNHRKRQSYAVWSDLFHENISPELIIMAFNAFRFCCTDRKDVFYVLTKRIRRAVRILKSGGVTPFPGVMIGTTVENRDARERLGLLDTLSLIGWQTFVSFEPLLEELPLGTWWMNYDWAIIGCETGSGRRHIAEASMRYVAAQHKRRGIPVWVKGVDRGPCVVRQTNQLPAWARRELPRIRWEDA